jgi:hypothetical protein
MGVKRFYPRISQVSLYQYRLVNPAPDAFLIQPEIVNAALLLLYVHYPAVLPVDNNLGFYGMPLLFS